MTDDHVDARLRFLEIDADTRAALREFRPEVEAHLPAILDEFYELVRQWPDVSRMFGGDSHMAHAKAKQVEHWMLIASGDFDAGYVASVRRIGQVHAKLGLEPRWYIAGYSFITSRLYGHIVDHFAPRTMKKGDDVARQMRFAKAINKAAMLDMDFAISIYLEESEKAKKAEIDALADGFEANVLGIVETVASAATELSHTAEGMSATAETTVEQSSAVSTAAEQATSNVSVIAASAEEMGRSVQEIAEQVAHSTRITGEAVERAEQTNETFERMSKSSDKIGEVVKLISDIAEQTNLLALNATIESARAGEAGKGFAVVAAEVKSLANQTAKATEDIAAQIQEMQEIARQSVEAIGAIKTTIEEINTVSMSVNAAVEEQSAATQEIARSTQEAAVGTQEVSGTITKVLDGARETGDASNQVVSAAGELGQQAETLREEVSKFLVSVRAS